MSIPILISYNPWTLRAPVPSPGVSETLGDQTLHRGGLEKIGDASTDCGGGPIYIVNCSGAYLQFDAITGIAHETGKPPDWDSTYQVRFDGAGASTEVGFDWRTSKGVGANGRRYVCTRTDQ
jgi:hypothetical protein